MPRLVQGITVVVVSLEVVLRIFVKEGASCRCNQGEGNDECEEGKDEVCIFFFASRHG